MRADAMGLPKRLDLPWAVLGAGLLVIGSLLGYYVFDSYRNTDQGASKTLHIQVTHLGDELQGQLESINAVMVDVRDSVPFWAAQKDGPDLARRHLSAMSHALEGVRTLSILDATGTVVASNRREVIGQNFADRDYFQLARRDHNANILYVSKPRESVLGIFVLLLVKAVVGPDGRFQGAVVTALDPVNFKLFLTRVRSTPDTGAGITHGSGQMFVVVPETLNQPGAHANLAGPFFTSHQASGETVTVTKGWSPTLQLERLVAHKTVQPVALGMDFPLIVSVGRDSGAIFEAWRTQAYGLAGFFLVLMLISIVGLRYFQRRQLVFRRVADDLAESNVRFAAFFESAMVGMAATSVEKGWLQVNPALCDMLGYAREALIEKNWANLTHPDDLATDLAQFERLAAGEINDYRLEKRYIRSDGSIVHAFVSVRAVRGADKRIDFLAAVIEDVTERKNAERQTHNATQMLQRFIDHMPGQAYVKDADSRILMANRGFDVLGYDHTQLIGKTNLEVIPGPIGEKITRDDTRVAQSGIAEVVLDELRGRFYETSRFILDDERGQHLIGGLTLDVTQRQRFIERAKILLAINDLAGKLPEKAFLTRGLEMAERLTGSDIAFLHSVNEDQETIELVTWTQNALKGYTAVHDAHHPISQAGIWTDCLREKQAAILNDYPAYCAKKGLPPGHVPLHRLISVPVIENGLVRLMLCIGNKRRDYDEFDIESVQLIGNDLWRIVRRIRVESMLQQRLSELTALNKKLAETQGQLLQSEKLSAIGQLAAGVAHEINNPIGFVHSNLGSLTEYVDDLLAVDRAYSAMENRVIAVLPGAFDGVHVLKKELDHDFIVEDSRQLLRESADGLQRVKEIVQDLKDFSRVGETGWLLADLHQGLESTLNIVRNEIKYKAEVLRDFGDLPPVYCIPSQINQVFMNLLVNAAQAIESHGHITLRTGCDGAMAWVEVQDDGCGIAPDKVDRVFEPFYTTKPVGKGTGLGLSLAWGIVQRHQGTLGLKSGLGNGSTFRVSLPISGPAIHAVTATAEKPTN